MKIKILMFLVLGVLVYHHAYSQLKDTIMYEEQEKTLLSKATSYVRLSGEAGAYGEIYRITGRDKRRPSSTGRLFFRPTLTLFQNFSISFDFLLSTEGSAARQQINQFALHPDWGWGKAHIGDFNYELSRYSLSGVTIRGGGIEINPGIFRLHLVAGQIQRAIKSTVYNSMYSRYAAGIKLGIGKTEKSFFDINVLRSKDNVRSLPLDLRDTLRNYGTTPQENLVLSLGSKLNLFDGMFSLRAEGAGSVFSRDIYSNEMESKDIPEFIKNIYKPRISTNADYAYNVDMNFNYKIVNARFNYLLIGPGFTSHGISSIIGDKKILEGGLGFRLFNNALVIQGFYQNQKDNVASQKLYTTTRNNFSSMVNIRPSNYLLFNINISRFLMNNDAKKDSAKVENENTSIMVNTSVMFTLFGLNNTINFGYTTQAAKDKNIIRKGFDVNSQNINFAIMTLINPYWSVSPSVSVNIVDPQNRVKTTTTGLNLRIMNRILGGKLSNSLTFGSNNSSSVNLLSSSLQSSYSITHSQSITFLIKSSFYTIKGTKSRKFEEYTASLGYNYRF